MKRSEWERQRAAAFDRIWIRERNFDIAIRILERQVPTPATFDFEPHFACPRCGMPYQNATNLHNHIARCGGGR